MIGSTDSEKAGAEVGGDKDAQLLYHRIGTDQCMPPFMSYAASLDRSSVLT